MNPLNHLHVRPGLSPALFGRGLISALLLFGALGSGPIQTAVAAEPTNATAEVAAVSGTNSAAAEVAAALRAARAARGAAVPASDTNAVSGTNEVAKAGGDKGDSSEEIQLSFQNTPIDMIVQWLMQTTGKSVMKNQQVQGNVTISSAKKIPKRDAVNLVYRALSLDGISAIETPDYIMLVRESQEPKMSPELVSNTETNIPEGRQRLLKIFTLAHAQASDLRDRIRMVLSDKATVDADDRANQLYVTDYNENLRILGELIKALDVTTSSDIKVQIYPLKYAEAEEIGNLISMILNAQSPPPPAPGRPSPGGGSPRPSGGSSITMVGGMPPDFGSSSSSSSGGSGGAGASAVPPAQMVRIWPDKTANRLIVSAPKSKLPEVERLINILDTNKPEDVAVRVLPLKNVSALDVVKEIQPLYRALSGKSLKEMIEVSADDQSNSLIILSSEVNFKAIQKLVAALDTEDAQEKVMRTFTLKNADAQDVAKQLQDLNQEQGGTPRYIYIYGSSPGGKSKKMNVVADRRRNAVIVQAPPAQMEGIEKMIEELDATVDDGSLAPKIYHLKYVSASDIEDVLDELFLKKQQQRSYYDLIYEEIYGPSSSSSGEQNIGRLYGKVRITSEPYSNTLIVTANSRENLAVVEEMIEQLDQPAEAGESTIRVGLRFARAPVLAKNLNILFARNGSPLLRGGVQQPQSPNAPAQQQRSDQGSYNVSNFSLEQEMQEEGYFPWLGGQPDNPRGTDNRTVTRPISDLIDRVRVVPDQRGNALLVSANVHLLPQVMKLIESLDAPSDQVLIEARVVEVTSDFLDKLGVRWSPDGSKVFTADDFDNSILAHATADYQKGFGGNTRVNTPPVGTVAQALASLRSGTLSSSVSMDFLVQFLRKTADATVLGDPQITINDNEMGRLFVGQRVPTLTAQNNPALGGSTQNFEYQNVGVILEVTPHINNGGDVHLKIHVESSTVVPGQLVLGTVVIDTRNFRTDLTARDGQTLVLGGIIQKQISDTLRKTPILGDIPLLGWAFKKKDKIMHEVELMVFLRPKVVRSAEGAEELMQEIDRKAPLVKKWQEDAQPQKDKKK